MQFDNNKVISKQELHIIKAKILEFPQKEGITVGEFQPKDAPLLIVALMNQWVKRIDYFLAKEATIAEEAYSPLYRQMKQKRAYTFKEYNDLFKTDLDERDFLYYPIFEFLNILTHRQRKSFIFNKEPDVADYVETILEADLDVTKHFFLRKLAAVIAYSDLKKHAYISARIGTGKSEMMKLMFYNLQKRRILLYIKLFEYIEGYYSFLYVE